MGTGISIKDYLFFYVLFIPYLMIDLYHMATEVSEWEKRGMRE